jgi:hypothetical protein
MKDFWSYKISGGNKIALALIALFGSGYYCAVHFFSIPNACQCRAVIPPEFSETSLLDNSLGDANTFTVSPSKIEICYSKPPMKGQIDNDVGLSPKGCEFYKWRFDLEAVGERKTDIEATLLFNISYERSPPLFGKAETSTATALGKLFMNRARNACTFEAFQANGKVSAWGENKLTGVLECSTERSFYFNPWSWFPQTTGLFYTRIFYAIYRSSN